MAATPSSSTSPDIDGSDVLDQGVRLGLVAYGLVHLVVAWTAIQLALGESSGKASQTGALQQLAEDSMGGASLYAVALGFAALVFWQAAEALIGHRSEDGGKRVFKRVGSGVKAVVYGALAVSSVKIASGNGGRSKGTDTVTAQVMSAPGGQLIVGAAGLVVVAVGCYLAYKGVTQKFTKRLDTEGTSGNRRTPVVVLGTVGYVAKGVALAAIGGLFVSAAVQHDAQESGGLDQALHALLQQPFGRPLLIAVALGLAAYGLFCFLWARHLKRD
ncbi:DUF1206 domain-containing protein [Nocardioides sp. HDW12B]|uniref:DUF1206 domain-containing protein n=1 Tax=Nocardioides sp. HDW12B TaxID=2714939 RepID=UPI0014093FAF|nr:DUF1206 domain-containing protein [Nocardioides sp. HDW12B]QIK65797.1 DUF1206 domain-containing protein [Nocardioides sp. HDW12B]